MFIRLRSSWLVFIRLRSTWLCVYQAEEYTETLNGLECRQAKRRLETANIIYWFKNTRAATRRAEAKSAAAGRFPLYLDLGHQLEYLFRYGKCWSHGYGRSVTSQQPSPPSCCYYSCSVLIQEEEPATGWGGGAEEQIP